MQERSYGHLRILSLKGSDIYCRINEKVGNGQLSVCKENGKIDFELFNGFIDESLDTDYIENIYSDYKDTLLSKKFRAKKEYTLALINVSFDKYPVLAFNRRGNVFVRFGYERLYSYGKLKDRVYVEEINGSPTLIAIEVSNAESGKINHAPVENPLDGELLTDYFFYNPSTLTYNVRITAEGGLNIDRIADKALIRTELYEKGFTVDGVHYVRYKRSAGSSREGQCLFIAEPLYAPAMEWSLCGLSPEEIKDQASYQSYVSLTLSNIDKKISIPKKSILIIKDQVSIFTEKSVNVSLKGTNLEAKYEDTEISNKIWDGEALLDKSVFDENGYPDKGMMLLRNRFFKTCAFNTNLSEWFRDNNITSLKQLNGCYCVGAARKIQDIKLVITESSLKYLKFMPEGSTLADGFKRWVDNVFTGKGEDMFGVVKTDKARGPMGNLMARSNYQLLNTLPLSRTETEEFLKPSLDFLHNMQSDPAYLRYHTNLFLAYDEEAETEGIGAENYRSALVSDMIRRTDSFRHTGFYKDFRSDMCKSYKNRLKLGRTLIEGSYQTILGNGLELLHAIIDKNYVADTPLALFDGEIYSPRFEDGEELLCERSPHITMGNLLVAKNKHVPAISKYFNLGKANAIVCVNAIKSNLQQKLNGCDYDSDTMLITNNKALLSAAKRTYSDFGVPVCGVEHRDILDYTAEPKSLAELDIQIADNRIGAIVNLSQFLNSLYWDKKSKSADKKELERIYLDICKLAVLSGMEIDKAKRLYPVRTGSVLSAMAFYKQEYKASNQGFLPPFYAYITDDDGMKTSPLASLDTPMSFVFDIITEDKGRSPASRKISYASLFELNTEIKESGTDTNRKKQVLRLVSDASDRLRELARSMRKMSDSKKALARETSNLIFKECLEEVEKKLKSDYVYYLLLRELDKESDTNRVTKFASLLFALLCYANGGYLLNRVIGPGSDAYDLRLIKDDAVTDNGDTVQIFGHPHKKERLSKA